MHDAHDAAGPDAARAVHGRCDGEAQLGHHRERTGAYVGGGADHLFTSPDLSLHGNAEGIEVTAKRGKQWFSLDFTPPSGKRLEAGEYLGAEREPAAVSNAPGLDVSGDGAGCNNDYGT